MVNMYDDGENQWAFKRGSVYVYWLEGLLKSPSYLSRGRDIGLWGWLWALDTSSSDENPLVNIKWWHVPQAPLSKACNATWPQAEGIDICLLPWKPLCVGIFYKGSSGNIYNFIRTQEKSINCYKKSHEHYQVTCYRHIFVAMETIMCVGIFYKGS